MSLLIQARDLSHTYGGNQVFASVSLELHEGDRVALIGENGAGKSTLFRLLSREQTPVEGTISCKRNLLIGYLQQEVAIAPGQTIREAASGARSEAAPLEARLRVLEERMAGAPDDATLAAILEEYTDCQERLDALGSTDADARVESVLEGLGIPTARWDLPATRLSGGEKKLVGLARLLVQAPELLLLDEPDNHLDFAGRAWLERYIAGHRGAVLVVSHDRYFLDRAVSRILELEDGALLEYQGGYSAYLAAKRARLERASQLREVRQRELKQIKRSAEQLTQWARQNPKFAGRAQNRWRMLAERQTALAETPAPVLDRRTIGVQLETRRGAARVLQLDGLGHAYGERTILRPFDLTIGHGERVGLVGANGSGKTTLFRLLLGQEAPGSGALRLGPTIRAGYYAQEHETLDPQSTPLATVRALGTMSEERALAFLRRLLFDRDDALTPIAALSGGERSRLQIAALMLGGANLLLLDEPTNNLDIPSCEALEAALEGFEGTVLAISHDRYFLNRLATRIVELDNGIVRDYPGDFAYYEEHRGRGSMLTRQSQTPERTRRPPAHQGTDRHNGHPQADTRAHGGKGGR